MHAGTDHPSDPGILGRTSELARLDRLLAAVDGGGPQVLVLTGEPGAGKSTLVDWTAERGRARGLGILRVRGSEGEVVLGLSGVHQLLHPLLPGDDLPAGHREALDRAFGPEAAQYELKLDQMSLCVSVLGLITEAAARRPLLLLVDDAQWLDLGSVDVLAFLARRLEGRPVVLLLAAREEGVPGRFDRDFPQVTVGPLSRTAAGRLLDVQPDPPRGKARAEILQQAAGNPLALIELPRALARGRTGDTGAGAAGGATLPLTARLENLFAADLPGLPAPTRAALLLVAAAGPARLTDLIRAAPELDVVQALDPAERSGLVRVADGRVLLRHPLVRSAVYHAASFHERRQAHLALAAALAEEPDRRAWHLAAAATGQDPEVADALAESAERARGRGGYAAAATALERAAELTSVPELRARRLLSAAQAAMFAGHPQWVGEMSGRVGGMTEDPRLRAEASLLGGWALGVTLRHEEALALLLGVAEATAASAPDLALDALSTAATSVYNSGAPYDRSELHRISGLIDEDGDPAACAWIRAVIDPHHERPRLARLLTERLAALAQEESLGDLTALGGTTWILDETEQAVRILGRTMDLLRRAGSAGTNATVTQALALVLFENGSWTAAEEAAHEAFWMATEAGADSVTVGARILRATLRALEGDHVAARTQAMRAVHGVDLRNSLNLQVRHRHAMGMAAFVAGDHADAYEQLRATFTHDFRPAPVHYHASLYYLGDLAAAAVRAERADDARTVVDAVERYLKPAPSPRLAAVLHRAAALLTDTDDAERHFRAALDDPATDCWPFEKALARLDFGEWLRRRRRSAEARPHLNAALECFQRLDARPWTDRTAAELRAAGAPAATAATPASELTAQERQIAELAAQGLTNRDIAARLYLSPRTVGYHLHKIFPKLGIRARAQLRDALSRDPRQ
ncbi:LuxR family transcriptional regulator [Streptomyces sp. 4503]|uniref:LuxR family transcriptional regulator n=1 Tax=Streptomyces niphimycinicus TaxID=2842201 RepID=A0ABS6C894_9ACTN|nr:LuxR family transcriptional regulator [Streptomyces niphimycinicus]MBU3863119.1 LuxR family transcriptional regulator [Streptomyces niphimycinicus]